MSKNAGRVLVREMMRKGGERRGESACELYTSVAKAPKDDSFGVIRPTIFELTKKLLYTFGDFRWLFFVAREFLKSGLAQWRLVRSRKSFEGQR